MSGRLLSLLPLCLAGCLVPLPLEAENVVDDGTALRITDATMPPFGTQVAMKEDTAFTYIVDVETESRSLAGRLYVQIDNSCCALSETDRQPADRIHSLGEASMVSPVESGHYRVSFENVLPCKGHVSRNTVAYVIPVLATGGFIGDSTGPLQAVGKLNKDHYWSVQCK